MLGGTVRKWYGNGTVLKRVPSYFCLWSRVYGWFIGFRKKNAHSVSFVRNGFRKKLVYFFNLKFCMGGFRKKDAHYGVVTNLDNFCDRIFNGAEVNPKCFILFCREDLD